MPRKPTDPRPRFFEKVKKKANGCWQWTAATFNDGYGAFQVSTGKTVRAPRYSWILAGYDLDDSVRLRHRCENPLCVNPAHLYKEKNIRPPRERFMSLMKRLPNGCVIVKNNYFDGLSSARFSLLMAGVETAKSNEIHRTCNTLHCVNAEHLLVVDGRRGSQEERFWRYVDKTGGKNKCWPWSGAFQTSGYGNFFLLKENGKTIKTGAHRFSWSLKNGDVPEGMLVLHRCDNPPCVNPRHLFVGSYTDNVQDMIRKGRSAHQKEANSKRKRRGMRRVFSCEEVRELTRQYQAGASYAELARRFDVHRTTVKMVVTKSGAYKDHR